MTFPAVASFAAASQMRLHAIQIVAASAIAACILWTLHLAWIPGIEEAISRLPERGAIRDGVLQWDDESPLHLTQSIFLGVLINLNGDSEAVQISDLRLEFRRTGLYVHSLFGYAEAPYRKGWRLALNRVELEPWWGAWKPFILAGMGVSIALALVLCWNVSALLYVVPIRVLAFYLDRKVTWAGCWKLGAATFFPGSAVMIGAVLLYALQQLTLLGLLIAFPLHLLVGWIYVCCCPAYLPKLPSLVSATQNPFSCGGDTHQTSADIRAET